MIEKNIILKEINSLKEYEFNNKIHWKNQIEKIKSSIREFWMNSPLIIDWKWVLIAGHWRLEACKQLWFKEVPCIVKNNLTEAQTRKYRLLDNKIAELSTDNIENINFELEELQDQNLIELYFDEDITEINEPYTWKWMDFPEQEQFRKQNDWQIHWEDLNIYSQQQDNVDWVDDILSDLENTDLPDTRQWVVRWLQIPVKQENYDEIWVEFKKAINNWVDVWLLLLNSLKDENNRNK